MHFVDTILTKVALGEEEERLGTHLFRRQHELIHGLMVIHVKKVKSISPRACTKCWLGFACVCRISDKAVSRPPQGKLAPHLCAPLSYSFTRIIHTQLKTKTEHRTFCRAEKSVEMDEKVSAGYRIVQMCAAAAK